MKEILFALYFEFYKTLKSNFPNTDEWTNKNSVERKK